MLIAQKSDGNLNHPWKTYLAEELFGALNRLKELEQRMAFWISRWNCVTVKCCHSPSESESCVLLQAVIAVKLQHQPLTAVRLQRQPLTAVKLQHQPLTAVRLQHQPLTAVKLQQQPLTAVRLQHQPLTAVRLQHQPLTAVKLQHQPQLPATCET